MTTSSASLAERAWNPETGTIDLGELYPPLRTYCPLYWLDPGISPQQAYFLLLDCEEAFYGGAAGGGKSAALLMGAIQYVHIPGYRALILRRTFQQLSKGEALIPLSHEWFANTDARWNETKHRWTFPSGATIEFGHVKDENSKHDYQGAAFQYIGFDELTQFSESVYEYIAFSRQRRRTDMAELGIPVRARSTSNPGGIGHGWVKRRFITDRTEGVVCIPAKVRDNPGLDADDYERRLRKLSPTLAAQLLEGDWDVFESMAYPMLNRDLHVISRLDLPDSFRRWEAMDHGVTNPTCWLLLASDYDGNTIVADEYYAPGLPAIHAAAVLDRRNTLWEAKNQDGWPERHPAYGDPASLRESLPVTDQWGDPLTLQAEYERHGIRLQPGNNRRKAGYVRVAELLTPQPGRLFPAWHPRAGEPGAPSMFIVANRCPNLLEQLENAPVASEETDPERGEAVDRRWESAHGHAHAALRYGVLGVAGQAPSQEPPEPEPEDPRAALLRRVEEKQREQQQERDSEYAPDYW